MPIAEFSPARKANAMLDSEKFKLFLIEQRNQRPRTVYYYLQTTKRLKKLVGRDDFVPDDIQRLKLQLKDQGYKASYINDYVDSSKLWAECFGLSGFNEIRDLPEQEPEKAIMSDIEIEKFLGLLPKRNGPKELRNHMRWTVFFSIMAFSGMRPGEVAKLTVDDVDFGSQVYRLRAENVKTNDYRNVPIASNVFDLVHKHIDDLPEGETLLFRSRRGGKKFGEMVVDNVDWHYNFHTRIKRLGIKRRYLTPYSLRHSFITSMLEQDVNIMKVQKIVGHRRLETTAHYTHLTTKDIINAISKHPLVKKHTDPRMTVKAISEAFKSFGLDSDPRFDFEMTETQDGVSIKLKIKPSDKPTTPLAEKNS